MQINFKTGKYQYNFDVVSNLGIVILIKPSEWI